MDDDQDVATSVAEMLTELGYAVFPEMDPEEALRVFSADPEYFDVLLTDLTMPRLTGEGLASEVVRIRPDVPVILFTGFSETITEEQARARGIKHVLRKPVTRWSLATAIRSVTAVGS